MFQREFPGNRFRSGVRVCEGVCLWVRHRLNPKPPTDENQVDTLLFSLDV